MRIGYITTYDAKDVRNWSGLGYYMAQHLQSDDTSLEYIQSSQRKISLLTKVKHKLYWNLYQADYLLDRDPAILKGYSKQISSKLKAQPLDIVFSPGTIPIAYLECDQPIAFWTDATFGGMINFYPEFTNLCRESIRQGHLMEKSALNRCQLAIYSSDWAAKTAIDLYEAESSKVKVVPFGANLDSKMDFSNIKSLINARKNKPCKLLFLGVNWQRKGGDVALEVARQLNESGLATELTIVGCEPPFRESMPEFVTVINFISKSTQQGIDQINGLLAESHFLILPSTADCTPVVFSEANSFGVPCLTTDVGGITTIIKNDINGKTFQTNANISEYCTYITHLFSDYTQYKELAISSFNEHQTRLNWQVAGQTVRSLLKDL